MLSNLSNEVFKSQSEITVYENWEDHFKKSSVNVKYCFITGIEITFIYLYKEFKTGHMFNIWMFSLDLIRQGLWVLVFVEDPLDLPFIHENIYVFRKIILK